MHYPVRPQPIPSATGRDGQVLTCLEHQATRHRVVDHGKERYSVPFKVILILRIIKYKVIISLLAAIVYLNYKFLLDMIQN